MVLGLMVQLKNVQIDVEAETTVRLSPTSIPYFSGNYLYHLKTLYSGAF
jgi:hypothetical protein